MVQIGNVAINDGSDFSFNARICNENVKAAKFVNARLHHSLHLIRLRHINRNARAAVSTELIT
jgi:hypothetical protein